MNKMNKQEKIQQLNELIAEYYANACTAEEVLSQAGLTPNQNATEIIANSQRGWDELPCDDEGFTLAQEEESEEYINSIAKDILACY